MPGQRRTVPASGLLRGGLAILGTAALLLLLAASPSAAAVQKSFTAKFKAQVDELVGDPLADP